MLVPVPLGHVFRSEAELIGHARRLDGATSGELAESLHSDAFVATPDTEGRTGLGVLVEGYFGKRQDNVSRPDFPELGIELKTLPMKRLRAGWSVKEPTSISLINYFDVDREPWDHAGVRAKLAKILWVPYEHDRQDKRGSRFRRPFLWRPPMSDWSLFEADYDVVRGMVRSGLAHELSETLCRTLAPRRKGAKGSETEQPRSAVPAKTRAWALKAAYTRPILARHVLCHSQVSLIEDVHAIPSIDRFEAYVESRMAAYEGLDLEEIAARTGARVAGGKSGPARFVRALLGVGEAGEIEEFSKLGIRIHTVWARSQDLRPFEATPFPAMDLREFADEEWEDSELLEHVDKILFIPLLSETRDSHRRTLGKAFFWSPSPMDWAIIEREWRHYQGQVRQGLARYMEGRPRRSGLTPAKETKRIHVRPHAANAADTDVDPFGVAVTRQSFWLNQEHVQKVLIGERARRSIDAR